MDRGPTAPLRHVDQKLQFLPEAPEVLVDRAGKVRLIRERQTLDQVHQNEITVTDSVF